MWRAHKKMMGAVADDGVEELHGEHVPAEQHVDGAHRVAHAPVALDVDPEQAVVVAVAQLARPEGPVECPVVVVGEGVAAEELLQAEVVDERADGGADEHRPAEDL
jgi:hypothetical protein